MFFLKKLIEAFIFPPGIIILAFLLIAAIGRKKKAVFLVSLFFAVILYAASIEPVANMLLNPLQNAYRRPGFLKKYSKDIKPPINLKHTAIVVLSSGAYNRDTLGGDTLNRLIGGFLLQKRFHIPIILSGGYAMGSFAISKVMRKILLKLGDDRSLIIIDDKSNDTYQNAMDTKMICERHGFKTVILVTSAYHMPRAMLLFKKAGFKEFRYEHGNHNNYNKFNSLNNNDYRSHKAYKSGNNNNENGKINKTEAITANIGYRVFPYPVDYKTSGAFNIYDYFPSLGSLLISTQALHEYLDYIYYAM